MMYNTNLKETIFYRSQKHPDVPSFADLGKGGVMANGEELKSNFFAKYSTFNLSDFFPLFGWGWGKSSPL